MPTVGARLREISRRLADAGVPSPQHDAVVLMAYTFGWSPSDVRTAAARDDHWAEDVLDHDLLEARVTRRANREPLQHITGTAPFRGLDLHVGSGVFIPRPETEVVTQVALDLAREAKPGKDGLVRVTDLCAGSGAIGLSIASEMENVQVSLVEASEEANVFLRLNHRMLPPSVRERVRPMLGDARGCLHLFDRCAQVVVTNPPYIPPNAVPRDQEVREYDPPQALYGLGEDGLEIPRGIIDEAVRLLDLGGWLVMEHGEEQGAALREYAESSPFWGEVHTRQDLTGRDRMLVARRVDV